MFSTRLRQALAVAAMAWWAPAGGQLAPAGEPAARVQTTGGESVEGETVSLDDGELRISDGAASKAIPRGDLLIWKARRSLRPVEAPHRVRFVHGDWIAGTIAASDESRLTVEWSLPEAPQMTLRIPLEIVAEIEFGRPEASASGAARTQSPSEAGGDEIRLRNGDLLKGDLLSLSPKQIEFQSGENRQQIPTANVAGLRMNPEFIVRPEIPSERQVVSLRTREHLTLSNAVIERGAVAGATVFGAGVEIPLAEVDSIVFLSDRVVPLSSLAPASVETTPFLKTVLPIRMDRNVLGRDLLLGGNRSLFGIGMHTRTTARWNLPPDAAAFQTTVGLDAAARPRGNVVFRIAADGSTLFDSGEVTPETALQPVRVSLTDKRELSLTADFGRGGDVLDYADWGDAFLILAPQQNKTD